MDYGKTNFPSNLNNDGKIVREIGPLFLCHGRNLDIYSNITLFQRTNVCLNMHISQQHILDV